jgi:hypothetical protein
MRTISKALDHKLITVVEREKTPGIIQLRFGDIPTIITIEISKTIDGRYAMQVDHQIKTSLQHGPYVLRSETYNTPGDALYAFQRAFSQFYEAAVRKGFSASEAWLVPTPPW